MSKRNKQPHLLQQNQSSPNFQITATRARFIGPLPPPEILAKYEQAMPGAVERIIAMAEGQSKHRQALETKVIESNCTVQKSGPIYGFIVCMTAIIGGVYLIHSGQQVGGLTSIITALAALATVFIYGRKQQKRDLKQKADALLNIPNP